MSNCLTFNGVNLEIIDRNGQPWVRGNQIGRALAYGQRGDQIDAPFAERSIRALYARHADEFTDAMTAVVTLPTEGGPQEVRIFSLRGCHLLAMFARTPVAKDFRRWVLDVLDRLAAEEAQPVTECHQLPTASDPLTPDQQCTLKSIVKGKVEAIPEADRPKGLYPQIWSRFNNHFRLGSYKQLPQCRMAEAIEYLMQLDLVPQPKALPGSDLYAPAGLEALMQLGYMPYDPSPISHLHEEDRRLDEIWRSIRGFEQRVDSMSRNNQMPPVPMGQDAAAHKLRETFLASCYVARRALGAIYEMGRAARIADRQKAIASA